MTRDPPVDGEITTAQEFDAALETLLSAADRNGIDPRGSWEYRNGDDADDLEVLIVELETEDGI